MTEGGSTMTDTGSTVAGVTEEWLAAAVVKESAEAIVVTDPAGIIRAVERRGRAHLWFFGR